jgi:LysM repeat protein
MIGLALLASSVISPLAEAQGCSVRTDWPVYTVVPGDTVAKIARRYNTSMATIINAICLTNPRVIYAGQQLRVPPGNTATGEVLAPATFQAYENGFMTWRSDTGLIWAFVNDGRVFTFPSITYGLLPENAVTDSSPFGRSPRFPSIMGFGRVWGNFTYVRDALGWAVASELSYTMAIYPISALSFGISHPQTSQWVQIDANRSTWAFIEGVFPTPYPVPTLPPPTTTAPVDVWATFQQFEHGFMTWHGDSGTVFVYLGSNGGSVSAFQSASYGALPDNPFFNTPPGRVRPIMGFGKVWGNFASVRDQLGWAVDSERGYMMRVQWQGNAFTFSLPDGQQVNNANFSTGALVAGALPTVTPVPTLPPATTTETAAAFQRYEHGFMIWRGDAEDVYVFYDSGTVMRYALDTYGGLPDNPFNGSPPPGWYKPVNAFGRVWGNFPLARDLGWATEPEQGYTSLVIPLPDGSGAYLSLPEGRSVFYSVSGTWQYGR